MRNLLLRVHIVLGVVVALPALGWSLSGLLYVLPNTVRGVSIDVIDSSRRIQITPADAMAAANRFSDR